ncbi:ABC transporter permease [Nocardioides sp. B-3]|uniref:ABC transporter permease n=1 Tax=Nocardioides sp. B-3 TaxID=2895565 RepID=UPI002152FBD5|nr:ABC transporter permease [Nocardioides sp. B-3]UUZ61243.1 hypothetical protein LP418_11960 [Nocardioides sp. B-3]
MTSWRAALRIAFRDTLRARGRSLLVLFMIALPVLAVTAAAVIRATQDVSGSEGAQRTMGAADARIKPVGGNLFQSPDPKEWGWGSMGDIGKSEMPTFESVTEVLGDVHAITIRDGYTEIPLGERRIAVNATEVDLKDPLAKGLFDVTSGRYPEKAGEAVINDTLRLRGIDLGDTVTVGESSLVVVGTGRDASVRDMGTIATLPDGFGEAFAEMYPDGLDWLVGGGPISWSTVREMNKDGLVVTSRAVLADPPPVEEMAEAMDVDTGYQDYPAVVALIVTMALLEVVLLAGPAFAVSARRQARTLALMAASGATPRQARRVVLASGVVLGALAAAVGAVPGVIVGVALLPLAQRFNGQWFGPLDVDWRIVAVVAAFGLLSALPAAVVPAFIASRQDVVAVLAGRRGDRPPSTRTPVPGLVLLGLGVALSVFGSGTGNTGAYLIAIGAIVSVFGMIFVVGLVVALVSRLSRRFPLVLRYAARDAARHRTRTVPAVAAVAATVAGVVALGIATTSDEKQNRENYTASMPMGTGTVNLYSTSEFDGTVTPPSAEDWAEIEGPVHARIDDIEVIEGISRETDDGYYNVEFRVPGDRYLLDGWGGRISSAMIVADTLPGFVDVSEDQRSIAVRALADGEAVVFTSHLVEADEVVVRTDIWNPGTEKSTKGRFTLPAVFVRASKGYPVAQAIIPNSLVEQVGQPVRTAGFYLPSDSLTVAEETDFLEALHGISENASVYVERGYEAPDEAVIIQLILAAPGGVLMLGGTLTATFLALSDARPDLATLSAVGAAPRSRRGVAASYALVVGFVGAVLGAPVGFIPGIAITRPLTYQPANYYGADGVASGPYLDVPWLLILGLVVALPLLTAAIVGLTARSRLLRW